MSAHAQQANTMYARSREICARQKDAAARSGGVQRTQTAHHVPRECGAPLERRRMLLLPTLVIISAAHEPTYVTSFMSLPPPFPLVISSPYSRYNAVRPRILKYAVAAALNTAGIRPVTTPPPVTRRLLLLFCHDAILISIKIFLCWLFFRDRREMVFQRCPIISISRQDISPRWLPIPRDLKRVCLCLIGALHHAARSRACRVIREVDATPIRFSHILPFIWLFLRHASTLFFFRSHYTLRCFVYAEPSFSKFAFMPLKTPP